MPEKRIRTRFAPSPTGYLHIGGVRTALYAEFVAKQAGGDFLLRIEDTDQSRYVEGAVESLCSVMKQLGIEPVEGVWLDDTDKIIQKGDHGPYIQSERKHIHQEYAKKLIEMDKAYYCFCTAERLDEVRKMQELTKRPTGYDGHCRNLDADEVKKRLEAGEQHVVRLKLPEEGTVTVNDVIRGDVSFDWKLIDDQVIIKSDGMATYHLASMADDHDMEITHVIRGEEWLSSTPKHIFLYESMGWELPVFAHLPLILNPDKSKLSKRQGDVAAEDYLKKGYLPEALNNFLALLGWNPTADREIYTKQELIDLFDLSKVNKAGAVFQIDKLNWLNNHYLREMDEQSYFDLVLPHLNAFKEDEDFKKRVASLYRERMILPSEITDQSLYLFSDQLDYSNVSITWKDHTKEEAKSRLEAAIEWIEQIDDTKQYDAKFIEEYIKEMIQKNGWGNGDTLWPLRVSLSAQEKSPSPFELIAVLGKKQSTARVNQALATL
ncbi:MAG: glutamate--tRNA ligase [Patescibacteria group bacterium]|nr:glutamate--tRNA ligase [Patescibacteria group bacterium]